MGEPASQGRGGGRGQEPGLAQMLVTKVVRSLLSPSRPFLSLLPSPSAPTPGSRPKPPSSPLPSGRSLSQARPAVPCRAAGAAGKMAVSLRYLWPLLLCSPCLLIQIPDECE